MMMLKNFSDLFKDTLRALEEAIQNFSGCSIVGSWYRIATHILAFEKDGTH